MFPPLWLEKGWSMVRSTRSLPAASVSPPSADVISETRERRAPATVVVYER